MAHKKARKKPAEKRDPRDIRWDLEQKLREEGRDDLAQKLSDCAELMTLSCVCCGKSRTVERGCKRRWCPVCAPRITAERMMRLESVVSRFQWPLAVTLTMQNVTIAEGALEHVKKKFRDFRRTDFWADRVAGGVVGFEVTNTGRGWHPHLHALIDCRWLAVSTPEPQRGQSKAWKKKLCEAAQNELSEVWGAYVQGKKAIVWAERAWGKAMMETLKYAVKPSDLLDAAISASETIDMIDAGRMISSFGHAHAASKLFVGRDLPEEKLPQCEKCSGFKTTLPADIIEMYQARPDLAYARFHTLMSLSCDYWDPKEEWDPKKTLPPIVPKGFRPNKIREKPKPKPSEENAP